MKITQEELNSIPDEYKTLYYSIWWKEFIKDYNTYFDNMVLFIKTKIEIQILRDEIRRNINNNEDIKIFLNKELENVPKFLKALISIDYPDSFIETL